MQDYIEMVKATAKQHRLNLTPAEMEKFARDVPEVLALFSKLDEHTVSLSSTALGIDPSELRKYEVYKSEFNAFSNSSPKLIENGYFVAPRIKKQS